MLGKGVRFLGLGDIFVRLLVKFLRVLVVVIRSVVWIGFLMKCFGGLVWFEMVLDSVVCVVCVLLRLDWRVLVVLSCNL